MNLLAKFWEESGLPVHFLDDLHLNDNPDPVVNSSFKLGAVAQASNACTSNDIGLSALAAVYFHQLRTGVKQTVSIDPRHAILEFSCVPSTHQGSCTDYKSKESESYYLLDGAKPSGKLFDELAGLYRTNDSLVAIHTNFPHHKQGISDLLQCEPLRDSVQEVLLKWNSQDFEDEAARRKMCVTKSRTSQEWDGHPHAVALRSIPPVQLIKVADAPKRQSCGPWTYPLSGIRVLDLTRVLAGAVAGRTLAAHGADVLLIKITSPQLPDLPFPDKETSRGKRTTSRMNQTVSDS
ncbi:CoA-transferase family III [Sanghuangporus baumii]|uniref:CoA-transferase family III n=1 Tax=Sanghuangporus baumii TaxID=108892 RepID=A0A9Q5N2M7_SANBA|nr:CoA-transferase family III [Sanghuangporus baumii]